MNVDTLNEGGGEGHQLITINECGEAKYECEVGAALICDKSMGKATPSSRNATVRKPETECGVMNGTESHELKKLESGNMNISGCEFKKGGMCKIHQIKGEKIVTKIKEWVKKKNGLFGYVSKQQTTYRCSRRATIVGQPSPTDARDPIRELDSGLRLGVNLPGNNITWDCGVDKGGAGANPEKSESLE